MEINKKELFLKREKLYVILLSLIIFLINSMLIGKMKMIYLSTDEMGYISIAQYFAGNDWSNVMQYIAYYSYGYSIFIYPLAKIFKEPESLYKSIIVLNSVFITCIFPFSYYFMKKISNDTNKYILLSVAFCISLFSPNIVRANSALSEALIIFVFWILIYLFQSFKKDEKLSKIICFSILLSYLYMIHQRNIVIIIATAIVISIMFSRKDISKKNYLTFILTTLCMITINSYIKKYIQQNIFLDGSFVQINDFGGQKSKIIEFFMIDGFLSFCRTVLGHLYYLGVSTYLLGYFGIFYLINNGFKYFKYLFMHKQNGLDENEQILNIDNMYIELFILLSFLGAFFISCIWFINPDRLDHVFYGRYFEAMLGPILAYGFAKILKKGDENKKIFIMGSAFIIVISIILKLVLGDLGNYMFSRIKSVGINLYYYNQTLHLLLGCGVTIIFAIILFFGIKNKKYTSFVFIFIGITFLLIGLKTIDLTMDFMESNYAYKEPVEKFRKDKTIDNIYYYGYKLGVDAAYIQYLLYDRQLLLINGEEEENDKSIFTINSEKQSKFKGNYSLISENISEDILKNYKLNDFIKGIFFLTPKTEEEIKLGENIFDIPVNKFHSNYKAKENGELVSDGKQGFLINNSKFTLEAGRYEMSIELELLSSTGDDITTVKITKEDDENYVHVNIVKDNFGDNKITLKFNLDIPKRAYDFNTEIFVREGVILKANEISIKVLK